jgi:hypothetical protein
MRILDSVQKLLYHRIRAYTLSGRGKTIGNENVWFTWDIRFTGSYLKATVIMRNIPANAFFRMSHSPAHLIYCIL